MHRIRKVYANGFVFLFQIISESIILFHTIYYLVRAEAFIHVGCIVGNPPRRQKPQGINETEGNDHRAYVETSRFYEIRDVAIGR